MIDYSNIDIQQQPMDRLLEILEECINEHPDNCPPDIVDSITERIQQDFYAEAERIIEIASDPVLGVIQGGIEARKKITQLLMNPDIKIIVAFSGGKDSCAMDEFYALGVNDGYNTSASELNSETIPKQLLPNERDHQTRTKKIKTMQECQVCGKDITDLRKGRKFCNSKRCEREYVRRRKRKYQEKQKAVEQSPLPVREIETERSTAQQPVDDPVSTTSPNEEANVWWTDIASKDATTLKDQYELNKAIENLIESKRPGDVLTTEEKAFIAKFSGYGGLQSEMSEKEWDKRMLYEYYTPEPIVRKMWGLAYQYGYDGGPVLEPSAGTGAFLQYAPENAKIVAYEINPVAATILQNLYPNAEVIPKKFETRFIERRKTVKDRVTPEFDLVIGNPPYGKFGGIEAGLGEKGYTKAQNYVDYFIRRSLDVLLPGGLLVFVIGVEVSAGGIPFIEQTARKSKQAIMERSELVDAYRLPNGVFDRTDVLSDIIVLRKK